MWYVVKMFRDLIKSVTISLALVFPAALAHGQTPVNFKVAFIADQGLEPESQAVLNLTGVWPLAFLSQLPCSIFELHMTMVGDQQRARKATSQPGSSGCCRL